MSHPGTSGGGRARSTDADPLGKRALFAPPADLTGAAVTDPFAPPPPTGRRALFDQPATATGAATLRCHGCGRTTTLAWRDLPRVLVPSVWLPLRRPSRYLRCPACGRRTWADLDLHGLRPR